MIVAITGSRCVDSYEFVKEYLDELFEKIGAPTEIISGGARGADKLAEKYALENSIPFKLFKADWKQHGKRAGILRNIEMASYANLLISFWDMSSRGTQHMIRQVQLLGKPYKVKPYLLMYKDEQLTRSY